MKIKESNNSLFAWMLVYRSKCQCGGKITHLGPTNNLCPIMETITSFSVLYKKASALNEVKNPTQGQNNSRIFICIK